MATIGVIWGIQDDLYHTLVALKSKSLNQNSFSFFSVLKMVKHTQKNLAARYKIFNACLTIVWTPGIIGPTHFVSMLPFYFSGFCSALNGNMGKFSYGNSETSKWKNKYLKNV